MAMLALAGCRDASGDSAQADNSALPAAIALPPAPLAMAEPDLPAAPVAPAAPSPSVTVRAQPAPHNALDLPASDEEASVEPFPREVTAFMVDRDSCDHFRGEQPYDAERRAYIADNVAELCTGTDAKLAMLRRRYAADPAVTAALKGYDDRIEGVGTY
jgi:hypothetical protein